LHKIVFIVPPRVHLLDINGPAHIFYEAKALGLDCELHFVSMDGKKKIDSSAGLQFSDLKNFKNIKLGSDDYIFIPGMEFEVVASDRFSQEYGSFLSWLRKKHEAMVNICSVCSGAFILAAAGVLRGKECTTHWRFKDRLQEMYPRITIKSNRLFVQDENIYCSAGVSSGIDLALYILEGLSNAGVVSRIAQEIVYPLRRDESDPQLNIYLQYRNHLDNRIFTIQDYMVKNLDASFTIETLATLVNMSARNLTRLFKKKTTLTIHEYLSKLRIEKATQLLSSGHKVDSVASACGLNSTNQLRNLFKKHLGKNPSALF